MQMDLGWQLGQGICGEFQCTDCGSGAMHEAITHTIDKARFTHTVACSGNPVKMVIPVGHHNTVGNDKKSSVSVTLGDQRIASGIDVYTHALQ